MNLAAQRSYISSLVQLPSPTTYKNATCHALASTSQHTIRMGPHACEFACVHTFLQACMRACVCVCVCVCACIVSARVGGN